MKEKLVNKFDKVIHDVKRISSEISKERKSYRKSVDRLKTKHDSETSGLITELQEVLMELYDIYADTDELPEGTAPQA